MAEKLSENQREVLEEAIAGNGEVLLPLGQLELAQDLERRGAGDFKEFPNQLTVRFRINAIGRAAVRDGTL